MAHLQLHTDSCACHKNLKRSFELTLAFNLARISFERPQPAVAIVNGRKLLLDI